MLKVFVHYFPSHTLQQVLFDALLLFLVVLVAVISLASPSVPIGRYLFRRRLSLRSPWWA